MDFKKDGMLFIHETEKYLYWNPKATHDAIPKIYTIRKSEEFNVPAVMIYPY
jgi:hypothetical protein